MEEIRAFYLENKSLELAYFVIKSASGASVQSKLLRKGQSGMVDLNEAEGKIKDGEEVWLEFNNINRGRPLIPLAPGKNPPVKRVSSKKFIYRKASPFRANYLAGWFISKRPLEPTFTLKYLGLEKFFDDGLDNEATAVQVNGIYYYLNPDDMTASVGMNPEKYRGVVNIPENIEYKGKKYCVNAISDMAFDLCFELTKLTIPSTVKYIGMGAFSECKNLESVEIPEGVKEIRECTFYGCGIHSLLLPSSMGAIGIKAISDCKNLSRIVSEKTTPPYVEDNTFDDTDKSECTVYVPKGCKKNYRENKDWKDFIIFEEE